MYFLIFSLNNAPPFLKIEISDVNTCKKYTDSRIRVYNKKSTTMHLAIDSAISELGPEGPRVIVLFSDGVATDPDAAMYAANKAKEDGIIIYTVGTGKDIKKEELNHLASFPRCSVSLAKFSSIIVDILKMNATTNYGKYLVHVNITITYNNITFF